MIFEKIAIEYRASKEDVFYKIVYRQKLGHLVFRSKMNSFIPPKTDILIEKNSKPVWQHLLKDATLRYYYFETLQQAIDAIEELNGE